MDQEKSNQAEARLVLISVPLLFLCLGGVGLIIFALLSSEVHLQVLASAGGLFCMYTFFIFFNRQLIKIREVRGENWPF